MVSEVCIFTREDYFQNHQIDAYFRNDAQFNKQRKKANPDLLPGICCLHFTLGGDSLPC